MTTTAMRRRDRLPKRLLYHRLLIVEDSGKRAGNGAIVWVCRCQCGSLHYASTSNLTGDHVTSCGCWREENGKRPNNERGR